MDAFEQIIAEIFWKEGYWVQTSVKVNLTKREKRLLKTPSMPRPEIDVLAYSGLRNEIKAIECKSFLNSRGVIADEVLGLSQSGRYKLFTNKQLRNVVLNALRAQLIRNGACSKNTKITLCLACGKIPSEINRTKLQQHFKKMRWELFDDSWMGERVRAMADVDYENQVSTVVAKLLRSHFRK